MGWGVDRDARLTRRGTSGCIHSRPRRLPSVFVFFLHYFLQIQASGWPISHFTYYKMSGRQQRVMVQPIVRQIYVCCSFADTFEHQNVIFKNLQQVRATLNVYASIDTNCTLKRTKVSIWLYDNIDMRIEGRIIVRFFLSFHVHNTRQTSCDPKP
jgi:hypothetical protein